jgi:hypothetical protein
MTRRAAFRALNPAEPVRTGDCGIWAGLN